MSQKIRKCLFHQMSSYFEKVFCEYHCGFRQGLGAQYCLIPMNEKSKNCRFSTDFSKPFNCLPYDLIIGNLIMVKGLRFQFVIIRVDTQLFWFGNNQMKANPDKGNLITSCSDKVSICVNKIQH